MKKLKLMKLSKNEDSDCFSELPEHLIHHILSFVPLKDVGRTSILSKTWRSLCSSYNIVSYLYYDHNSFALQSLLNADESEPKRIDEIRDRFIDYADNHLLGLIQQQSRVLKLTIDVAAIDSEFARVDQLMDLVRKAKVEELSIFVQTQDFRWYWYDEKWYEKSIFYEFPYSLILASEWLQSLTVKWCKFTHQIPLPGKNNAGMFSSLRQLWLSQVLLLGEESLSNLASCCSGIELIEFDSCCFSTATLKLSKFPKLKKAYLINDQVDLHYVDITETNLETLYCSSFDMQCLVSLAACSTIRELALIECCVNQPDLLSNLATYFPLLEEAKLFDVMPIEGSLDRITAANPHIRTLELRYDSGIKVIRIEGPNLKHFNCRGVGFEELYMDCPKLRSLYYSCQSKDVPRLILYDLPTDIKNVSFTFDVRYALHTPWFINLRKYLQQIKGCNNVHLRLNISPDLTEFVLDEFWAAQTFELNNVHLQVKIDKYGGKHFVSEALVDGLLWSIQPVTLSIEGYDCYDFIKHLCKRLAEKFRDKSCCDYRLCNKCWWHNISDFQVKHRNKDMKWKPRHQGSFGQISLIDRVPTHFEFQWHNIESFIAKLLVEMAGSNLNPSNNSYSLVVHTQLKN